MAAPDETTKATALTRRLDWLGASATACALTLSLLSYALAASQPMSKNFQQVRLFEAWADAAVWLPGALRGALRDGGPFRGAAFYLAYCTPLLLITLCACTALAFIWRGRTAINETHVRRVMFWSLALAFAWVPAFNVLTQDFWLSAAWGRMVNAGLNPFVVPFDSASAAGLPLDHEPIRATYGPLWILVSSAITALSFGSPLLIWIMFKALILANWIGVLCLIHTLTRKQTPLERCAALLLIGWVPLCGHSSVAEGHNDVAMVFLMLLWLKRMPDFTPVGPAALAASSLSKYVTGPLGIVDLIYHRSKGLWPVLRRGLPAAIGFVGILMIWQRSPGVFTQTTSMVEWRFFDIAGLVGLLERHAGISIPGEAGIVLIAGLGFALWRLLPLWRAPCEANAHEAALTIMAVILFAAVGHVWPWFFIWCVPLAVLRLRSPLAWFVLGASVLAPFMIVHWWHWPDASATLKKDIPALAMYACAALAATACLRLRSASNRPPHG